MRTPGLGKSQQAILDALKRRGAATTPELAAALGRNVETVRDHLKVLVGHGLVVRAGRGGKASRGRPEVAYRLAASAEALFPRREGETLRDFVTYLGATGNEALLGDYFDDLLGSRRQAVLARVEHLDGRARLDEVARILTELGFMATVDETDAGARLRLCHCPLRDLVAASRIPCRAEIGFVSELLGEPLTRERYIPAGDASCSYRVEGPAC